MSAFIVSKKHIDLMVSAWLMSRPESAVSPEDELGAMLWRENHRSVDYRYGENAWPASKRPVIPGPYRFERYVGVIDPTTVIKQVQCYEYQACEHPGWDDSGAKSFCQRLIDRLIATLPGYDVAPWGI